MSHTLRHHRLPSFWSLMNLQKKKAWCQYWYDECVCVYMCMGGSVDEWRMGGDGARGATLGEVFKDVDTSFCQCAWYCGSTTMARSNSPWISARPISCHSGAGLYGRPIHAPKPRSAANPMSEEADLWLHSHTWFHYALVKRLRLLQTRRCRCSVSSGEDADGRTGEGKDEGKRHEERK